MTSFLRRQANPPNSPNPPRPQPGRLRPAITARVIQHSKQLGLKYQINSRIRVNPFTWFMSTRFVMFEHTTGIQYLHEPTPDILCLENTASGIGRILGSLTPDSALVANPQNLSAVLDGTKPSRGGWRILYITIANQNLSLNDVKNLFNRCLLRFGNFLEVNTAEAISILVQNQIISSREAPIASEIFDFLYARDQFLGGLNY